jgi:putative aldouronate transport system permease protein
MPRIVSKKPSDLIIDVLIYVCLILLASATVIPFLQVITISLSPSHIASSFGLHLFPTEITLEGYRSVLQHDLIWRAYANTILRTVIGTSMSITLLVLGGYPLSKRYLPHRRFWTAFIVFTMYFQGGIVPRFILVNGLGLRDSLWALILPKAVYAFNLIIVRNFFMAMPPEVEESAKIDGAKDLSILFRIVIPLSMPVIATVTLWSAVYHWNQWFDCMIYIQSQTKFVLQYVLRLILIEGQQEYMASSRTEYVSTDTMRMATLIVATLPIILTYPFLQKYFVKGVLIGAVKG